MLPSNDVTEQPGEHEQCRQLCHTLDDIQHGAHLHRCQQPQGRNQQRQPPAIGCDDRKGLAEQAARQPEEQRAAQQVNHQVGVFQRPQIAGAGEPVGQQAQHRQGPPADAECGSGQKLLPSEGAGLHIRQGFQILEIVQQHGPGHGPGQTRPVDRRGEEQTRPQQCALDTRAARGRGHGRRDR